MSAAATAAASALPRLLGLRLGVRLAVHLAAAPPPRPWPAQTAHTARATRHPLVTLASGAGRPATPPAAAGAAAAQHRSRLCLRAASSSSAPGSPAQQQGGGGADDAGADTVAAVTRAYDAAAQRVAQALALADAGAAQARLASLQHDASDKALWQADPARAQALSQEIAALRDELAEAEGFSARLEDAAFALELAALESSPAELASLLAQARASLAQLGAGLERFELRVLLSGPYDDAGALLTISAGAGGVDAMDWAEMLERMYCRWAAEQGFAVSVEDRNPGEEAGIKSVELCITGGRWAYGYLKGEKGTHRLVRQSPFNAKGLRQTSFAGVEVVPLLQAQRAGAGALDIPDKDLEMSFMRSGGKGGQNVNKVETGVRLLHVPTGLAVKCTSHRTQQQNRAEALERLKAKLLVVLEEQQAAALADIRGDIVKAEWGQQIKNYVLHPYKLVKDTRTGHETSDVAGVLDGQLDGFIAAYLRHKGRQQQEARLSGAAAG